MTPEQAAGSIGREVVYKPNGDRGVIKSVNEHWVFVLYGGNGTPMATDPGMLSLAAPDG